LKSVINFLIVLLFIAVVRYRLQVDDGKILITSCIQQGGWQTWQTNFPRKAGKRVVSISCWKSCGTQSHQTLPLNRLFSEPSTFYQS